MEPPAPIPPSPPSAPARTNWLLFFVILLAPAVLTMISVPLSPRGSGFPPFIAVFGGGAAGIICGAMLARRAGVSLAMQILLGIVLAIALGVACIGMSYFGCVVVGGFQFP